MTWNGEELLGWRRYPGVLVFALLCVFGNVSAALGVPEVTTDKITITAPATGSVVVPGQTLRVSVSVASGSKFSAIQIIGEDIGISPPMESPPFSFVFTIPNEVIGPRKITALGISGPNKGAFSQPVVVDVERNTPLAGLNVSPSRIDFDFVGDQVNFSVLGQFSDGSQSDIAQSSKTTFTTNDPTVATVSADGVVTAVGVGTTGILVKYGGKLVVVPVAVLGERKFAGTPGSPNCTGKSVSALAQQYGGIDTAAAALGYGSVQGLQDAIKVHCGR